MATNLTTAGDHFHDWEPPHFGLPRAALVALLLVGGIIALCFWAATDLGPKPVPQAIQVTEATLTQLPKPTPPPPPKIIPPPKPVPAIIPKPIPVPSKIVVATKPPPPVHHIFKPVPKPVPQHTPPPPSPVPVSPVPPAPAAPPTSGIGPYYNNMYNIIQANQAVPPALAAMGVSGTATLAITVAPDGHVISVVVIKSSGVPLIDATAVDHAMHPNPAFPPFNNEMPGTPYKFTMQVEIDPNTDSGN